MQHFINIPSIPVKIRCSEPLSSRPAGGGSDGICSKKRWHLSGGVVGYDLLCSDLRGGLIEVLIKETSRLSFRSVCSFPPLTQRLRLLFYSEAVNQKYLNITAYGLLKESRLSSVPPAQGHFSSGDVNLLLCKSPSDVCFVFTQQKGDFSLQGSTKLNMKRVNPLRRFNTFRK